MSPLFYEKREGEAFVGKICEVPFPVHVHDVTEIVCLTQGSMKMTIAGKPISLLPGDIAVAFPTVAHSYDEVSGDADGLALIFAPGVISEFTHTLRSKSVVNPLLKADEKAPQLDAIIAQLKEISYQENSPLKLGYLHLFLSYLFSCLPLISGGRNPHSTMTYQVLHYISEHFTEPLTLENTAHAMGISRIHLSHIFSQQLHINFRQYINTLRIDRARTLLRNPSYSISQIAELCGYGNQRTFHRAFLAQCGMPPNQFREK